MSADLLNRFGGAWLTTILEPLVCRIAYHRGKRTKKYRLIWLYLLILTQGLGAVGCILLNRTYSSPAVFFLSISATGFGAGSISAFGNQIVSRPPQSYCEYIRFCITCVLILVVATRILPWLVSSGEIVGILIGGASGSSQKWRIGKIRKLKAVTLLTLIRLFAAFTGSTSTLTICRL